MWANLKLMLLGAIASLLLVVLPYNYYTGAFGINPYSVQEVNYTIDGNKIRIVSGFNIPTDKCEFNTLEVFGNYLGQWFLVPWENTLEDDVSGDRVKGDHTLRITGDMQYSFDTIEVRTRHLCGDDDPTTEIDERGLVDKLFARIPLDGKIKR